MACRELVLFVLVKRRPGARVGFCVSKKLGKAVVRNKLRRRLREVYRENAQNLNPRWDLVIVARKDAAQATFQELRTAFLGLTRRLNKNNGRPASPARSPSD